MEFDKKKSNKGKRARNFSLNKLTESWQRVTTIIKSKRTAVDFVFLVIMDASANNCQYINFNIGSATTVSRSWTIKVRVY